MFLSIDKNRLTKILIIIYVLGAITYGYVMANFVPCHDGIMTVCVDQNWQTQLGRCLMQYYINIRGAVEAPWLIGVMSFLFISVSVYMVTEILDIGDELWKLCIVSSIFVLNLTLINSAVAFIYLMDIYSLSLMFAVAAVFFFS